MRYHSLTFPRSRIAQWRQSPTLAEADLITSRVAYWIGLGAIMGLALLLRLWNLGSTDLWSDEIHTLRRIRLPLSESLDTVLYAGNQTPLYYLLLRMIPGASIEGVRLSAIVFGLISILLLSEITVRLYHNRTLALALAALLAVNPMHVILSRTARFYTLLLVVSLVVTICFILLLRGRRGRVLWAVFGVSSAFLYLLHYTGLALPALQFAVLLLNWRRYRDLLRRWMPVQIIAVAPLLVWYAILVLYWFTPYLGGLREFSYDYLGQTVHLTDAGISIGYLFVGFDGRWNWLLLPGMLVAAAGVIAGTRDALDAWRRGDHARSYWALLALVTVAVLFGLALVFGAQYRDRYYTVIHAALLIMFGLGVTRWARPLALSALVIVLLSASYSTFKIFRNGEYERTDWSSVTAYVGERFEPGDAILVGRDLLYDAFAEHFDGDPAVLESFVMLEPIVGSVPREEVMAVEPQGARVWVIFRMRHEGFHRQGWEYTDPLTPNLAPESDWLLMREERIIDSARFEGVVVYMLDGPAQ